MDLDMLTQRELILIDPVNPTPATLITLLTERLVQTGKVRNASVFINSVMKREAEGPTALGEELAVPHGKSDAVAQAAFALAILPQPINWTGIEGDEPVRLVFLLAIPPQEAGNTHIQLLTTLTSRLTEDAFREALLAVRTPDEVMALLCADSDEIAPQEKPVLQNKVVPAILGLISATAFLLAALSWNGNT